MPKHEPIFPLRHQREVRHLEHKTKHLKRSRRKFKKHSPKRPSGHKPFSKGSHRQ